MVGVLATSKIQTKFTHPFDRRDINTKKSEEEIIQRFTVASRSPFYNIRNRIRGERKPTGFQKLDSLQVATNDRIIDFKPSRACPLDVASVT